MNIRRRYQIRTVLVCAMLVASGGAASAGQSPVEHPYPLPTDDRIVQFTYSPDAIYTILAEKGEATHIQLAAGEGVTEKPALGDTYQWRVSGGPTNLYVSPLRPGISTTMTLVTNKRSYEFQLVSSPPGGMFYQKVFFDYPGVDHAVQLLAQAQATSFVAEKRRLDAQLMDPAADPTSYHYGYTITGDAPFRPVEVLDNGTKTFIHLPHTQDMPALFLEDSNGKRQLVAYRVHGDFLIVDRIASCFVLQLNDQVVKITAKAATQHWWAAPARSNP